MSQDPSRYVCPNCSGDMDGLKCKIRCPRCGYFESCSDLEPAPPFSNGPQALSKGPQALSRGPQALSDSPRALSKPPQEHRGR